MPEIENKYVFSPFYNRLKTQKRNHAEDIEQYCAKHGMREAIKEDLLHKLEEVYSIYF